MLVTTKNIEYKNLLPPEIKGNLLPVDLNDTTMEERRKKIITRMQERKLDVLFIYADREHGANFGYLTGFEPRFEEAVLVLHSNEKAYMLLGNEGLKMSNYSRISVTPIHTPYLSLPNQPMDNTQTLKELISTSEIKSGMSCGIIGWKMFTSKFENNKQIFDVPYFLVDLVRQIVGEEGSIENASDLFIDPENGARIIVNANEIAHYEYGAAQASRCIFKLINEIEVGKTEIELANNLSADGQPLSVTSICATGDRFTKAVVAPRYKKISLGDKFSTTMGLRGGLTCRSGYVATCEDDLEKENRDYIDKVVKPYYAAIATWYSTIGIGKTGGELYKAIDEVAPKAENGWFLNPGHYTSSDEWMCSPVYKNSSIKFKSGMMFQMDIIFDIPGYGGSNAEDGVVLADEKLQKEIELLYPSVWQRMIKRRDYVRNTLGIPMGDDVLPMSEICGYLRPFLLNKDKGMALVNK